MAKKRKTKNKKRSGKRAKRVSRAHSRKSIRRVKTRPKKTRGARISARRKGASKISRTPLSLKGLAKQDGKIKSLITLGKERGYITYDEILREFPTIEDNVTL